MEARLVRALSPLVEALEDLDIDILASLRAGRVAALVKMIEHDYYVSGKRASEAVERESSFNIIHLETMFKLDIFIARSDRFRMSSLGRRRSEALSEERVFFVTSAEDIVLHKLHWYRKGGEMSNHQWQDVIGVLKILDAKLDLDYLRRWAVELEVSDLLTRALSEAARDSNRD